MSTAGSRTWSAAIGARSTACTRCSPHPARTASAAAKARADSTSSGPTPTTILGPCAVVRCSVMASSLDCPVPPLFAGGGVVRRAVGPREGRQRALLSPVPGPGVACRTTRSGGDVGVAPGRTPSRVYVGSVNAARNSYDVVVVGGGHNALVSAAYLARAGLSVVVLERLHHTGGAAVSVEPFAGQPARLSRYSYLVSLMPEQLMADLDLDVRLASRTTASYTPWTRGERSGGLLVERPEGEATRASFLDLTGGERGVRRLGGVLRRGRPAGRGRGTDADAAPPPRARRPRPGRRAHLDRRGRGAAGPRDHPALRRRHGARRRRHRRAHRHLRLDGRPLARAEPVLPLPPDRQRHRRVAGADRRHGSGHRRARAGCRRRRGRDRHRRGRRVHHARPGRRRGRVARRRARSTR